MTVVPSVDISLCTSCQQIKASSCFGKHSRTKNGLHYHCRECKKEKARHLYAKDPIYHRAKVKRLRDANLIRFMVRQAKNRAKKRNLAFDLDQYVTELGSRLDAGRCELTGIMFERNVGRSWRNPSIDRIVAKGGYTYDNIRIVLFGYNVAMNDWGEKALFTMIDARRNKIPEPKEVTWPSGSVWD
jgi:hypothetical protein